MVTLRPVDRALIPRATAAAERISARNYDEFQSDREIWEVLEGRPESVLAITMAHCAVASPEQILEEGSDAALARAAANLERLVGSELTREVRDLMWVYEIADRERPEVRQIGLGGMARTGDIRSDANPQGSIVRNEGVRAAKARGRADLIARTQSFIGTVNLAVEDGAGRLAGALEAVADSRPCDYGAVDEAGNCHRVWLLTDEGAQRRLAELLAAEPYAYVADGNHRSAAAAMLGCEEFLSVFFPAGRMRIAPYHRLVEVPRLAAGELARRLEPAFEMAAVDAGPAQPERIHEIGLYDGQAWHRLVPRKGTYDPDDAVQAIDADIVQRHLFAPAFGIENAADERLTFVGGDRDLSYLEARVDAGEASYAVALAPVTMEQFMAVCRQGAFMPPKSTWFTPKVRSGLVIALL